MCPENQVGAGQRKLEGVGWLYTVTRMEEGDSGSPTTDFFVWGSVTRV